MMCFLLLSYFVLFCGQYLFFEILLISSMGFCKRGIDAVVIRLVSSEVEVVLKYININ